MGGLVQGQVAGLMVDRVFDQDAQRQVTVFPPIPGGLSEDFLRQGGVLRGQIMDALQVRQVQDAILKLYGAREIICGLQRRQQGRIGLAQDVTFHRLKADAIGARVGRARLSFFHQGFVIVGKGKKLGPDSIVFFALRGHVSRLKKGKGLLNGAE